MEVVEAENVIWFLEVPAQTCSNCAGEGHSMFVEENETLPLFTTLTHKHTHTHQEMTRTEANKNSHAPHKGS